MKPDKISGKTSVVWSIVQSTTNDIQSVKCYEKEGMTQSCDVGILVQHVDTLPDMCNHWVW